MTFSGGACLTICSQPDSPLSNNNIHLNSSSNSSSSTLPSNTANSPSLSTNNLLPRLHLPRRRRLLHNNNGPSRSGTNPPLR